MEQLVVRSSRAGEVATLAVEGAVDLATAPELAAAVAAVIDAGADRIVIDCAELAFIDSTGISVLVRAWAELRGRASMPVEVVNLRPNVQRVLEVCGITDLLRS